MKSLKIKNVIWSDGKGNMVKSKVKDYETDHISQGNRFLERKGYFCKILTLHRAHGHPENHHTFSQIQGIPPDNPGGTSGGGRASGKRPYACTYSAHIRRSHTQ